MEKFLKNKMQELSSSVDCFDRISERAFSGKTTDFTEGGYTVNDLEKVTSERKKHPVLKWTAAAAAVLLIIGILPKTAQVNRRKSEREAASVSLQTYREITDKIMEIENDPVSYASKDMPLSRYLENDIFIDPLFTCPFEASPKHDIMVRYYIKMYGNYPTNEVYAVEYSGEFNESNFIAAASSGVSFTDEELRTIETEESAPETVNKAFTELLSEYGTASAKSAGAHFSCGDDGKIIDSSGNSAYTASYAYPSYYKTESGKVIPLVTGVEYCRLPDSGEYFYSTYYITGTDKNALENENHIGGWKDSVYHSGKLSIPKGSSRRWQKTGFVSNEADNADIISVKAADLAATSFSGVLNYNELDNIKVFDTNGKLISEVQLPAGQTQLLTARLYLPYSIIPKDASSSDSIAILESTQYNYSVVIYLSDIELPVSNISQ